MNRLVFSAVLLTLPFWTLPVTGKEPKLDPRLIMQGGSGGTFGAVTTNGRRDDNISRILISLTAGAELSFARNWGMGSQLSMFSWETNYEASGPHRTLDWSIVPQYRIPGSVDQRSYALDWVFEAAVGPSFDFVDPPGNNLTDESIDKGIGLHLGPMLGADYWWPNRKVLGSIRLGVIYHRFTHRFIHQFAGPFEDRVTYQPTTIFLRLGIGFPFSAFRLPSSSAQ